MYTVDVIIPTYKPDKELLQLLDMLKVQTVKPDRILILNTEEKCFDQLVYGSDFYKKYPDCKVYHHSRREFDHGGTRNKGVKRSQAEYFVMMTQDAIPADANLLEQLLKPLIEKKAAVSYARQLPKKDCQPAERYVRAFNYPKESCLKGQQDVERLGIKTYFCSDVCAAYDREIFVSLGGFLKRAIFNEDMIYAAKAAKAGYKIAYCGDALVYHSHNYSPKEQLKRNFDLGVSQAEHPEVFAGLSSEGEGIRMVKQTLAYLWSEGYKRAIPGFIVQCGAKWIGYRLGRNYRRLGERLILRCTASPLYFKRQPAGKDSERNDSRNERS